MDGILQNNKNIMDKKSQVKKMFDSISGRYDFLNHFLSVGIDFYWRKKALQLTKINHSSILLDIACGTGDFAIAAKKKGVDKIFGADLSANMLRHFNKKSEWSKGVIIQSVAEHLPFSPESFTNVTVAFGVRNFYDIPNSFDEIHRILKSGGQLTVLEFRLPSNRFVRNFYTFYFNKILPFIGKHVSKNNEAYTYLPESVNEFDQKINLPDLMKDAGFKNIKIHSMTLGIVQITIGEK